MQIMGSVLEAEADRCARLRRIATGAFIAALVMAAAAFALCALAGTSPACGCALCAAAVGLMAIAISYGEAEGAYRLLAGMYR